MTSALLDDIANAPDPPEPEKPPVDDWESAEIVPSPQRTRQRRTRKPKIDPDTGEEIQSTRVPRNATLKEQLLEPYVSIASDLATVAPTVAGVLIIRAEKTVDGIVDLASGHKRTMAALRKAAKGSKVIDVIETLLMIVIAGAVDFGRIPLESPLLDTIGHVEIQRDANGKYVKDSQGKMIKEKTTIREIRNKMVPEEQETVPAGPPPMPNWQDFSRDTGTGPLRGPIPMNNVFMEPR